MNYHRTFVVNSCISTLTRKSCYPHHDRLRTGLYGLNGSQLITYLQSTTCCLSLCLPLLATFQHRSLSVLWLVPIEVQSSTVRLSNYSQRSAIRVQAMVSSYVSYWISYLVTWLFGGHNAGYTSFMTLYNLYPPKQTISFIWILVWRLIRSVYSVKMYALFDSDIGVSETSYSARIQKRGGRRWPSR